MTETTAERTTTAPLPPARCWNCGEVEKDGLRQGDLCRECHDLVTQHGVR